MTAHLCECGCGQQTRLSPQKDTAAGYEKGQPYRFLRGHSQSVVTRIADELAVAYHTGRIDRRRGNPYRTARTDTIGEAYARGYEAVSL